nr:unnamed protein product [Timema poppensis]
MAPIFFAYERTSIALKKTNLALSVFNTLLQRQGTKFAAGDEVTIADFSLVTATMCLEAINFDLGQYPLVKKWYSDFKQQLPLAWDIAEVGMLEIREFDRNPPDLSALEHPIHPTRKNK